jgi:AcrR family transcriptional regulator
MKKTKESAGTQPTQQRAVITRAGLLEAVVANLIETGYGNTTIRVVAERAGTSPGALQHHFGTRDQMIVAALAFLFDEFIRRLDHLLSQAPAARGPAAEAREIVATMWDFYGSELNVAVQEIVVGARTHPALHQEITALREKIVASYMAPWKKLMAHTTLPPQQQTDLMQFAISTLRGLALIHLYQHEDQRFFARQLKILGSVIAQAIESGAFDPSPQAKGRK